MNIILIWSSYFLLMFTILDSMVRDHSFFFTVFLSQNYYSHILSLPVIATLHISILCHNLTIILFAQVTLSSTTTPTILYHLESINSNTFTASILNFMITYHNYSLEVICSSLHHTLNSAFLALLLVKLNVEKEKIAIPMTSLILNTWLQTATLQWNITHIANLLYHSLKWLCTTSFPQ